MGDMDDLTFPLGANLRPAASRAQIGDTPGDVRLLNWDGEPAGNIVGWQSFASDSKSAGWIHDL
jgi:hypothetical protein